MGGLEQHSPHTLRHDFAGLLLSSSVACRVLLRVAQEASPDAAGITLGVQLSEPYAPIAALLLGQLLAIGLAVAALAGAAVVVGGQLLRLPPTPLAIGGAALCFWLRVGGIRRGWGLPVARGSSEPGG